MLKDLIISSRPKQWYKNILVFVCIVFSYNLFNTSMWIDVILAFIFFCMLSASEYIFNDLVDIERDKKHPVKSQRPIASGRFKVPYALFFALLFIAVALAGSYLVVNANFFLLAASYLVLIFLYTLVLKHIIIADILIISLGFVFRAIAGCLAISVFISPWLIVCTFLLALFLAIGKRRSELVILGDEAKAHRASLSGYSSEILDQMLVVTIGACIVSYLMYTFFVGNYYMMFTATFVVYGLFRYLFLIHQGNFGGEPERIFKDKPMLINLAIWALLIVLILYIIPA